VSGVEELQEALRSGQPVTDDELLLAAAELLRGLDELVAELRAENEALRLEVSQSCGSSPRTPPSRLRRGRRP
jgi:hypothetical protein